MKYFKIFSFSIFFLTLVSCSSDSSNSSCTLTSYKAFIQLPDDFHPIGFNSAFSGDIKLEYANGKIIKIHGGPVKFGIGQYNYYYSDDTVTDINRVGDTIKVVNLITTNQLPETNSYIISNNELKYRKSDYVGHYSNEFTYQNSAEGIDEIFNGNLNRKFYMTDGNLVKVEQIFHDGTTITGKKDILYSNYDNSKNLLKGKFFIPGAFYNAFSNNICSKTEVFNYNYVNGEYIPGSQGVQNITYTVNSDNIADVFTQNCP